MKYSINKDPRGPLYLTEDDKIKLNYNCPDSEKSGEGKGSCGGSSGEKESDKGYKAGGKPKEVTPAGFGRQSDFDRIGMKIAREKGGISKMNKEQREMLSPKAIAKLEKEESSKSGSSGKSKSSEESKEEESEKSTLIDHHQITLKTTGDSNKKTFEREDSNRKAEVIKTKSGDYDVKLDDDQVFSGRSKSNAETIAKNYAAHGYKEGSKEVATK